eukprot:7192723-Prymnesium_polylepis.1
MNSCTALGGASVQSRDVFAAAIGRRSARVLSSIRSLLCYSLYRGVEAGLCTVGPLAAFCLVIMGRSRRSLLITH